MASQEHRVMGLTKRISSRGKKIVMNPTVMRWISDDRVMKAAEGVMDARTRVRAAWKVLLSGHDLPAVDPALDDFIGESAPPVVAKNGNGYANGHTNGHANGHTNGHANGHTNGHATNGHTNGHANGHTNGHGSNGHATVTGGVALLDQGL